MIRLYGFGFRQLTRKWFQVIMTYSSFPVLHKVGDLGIFVLFNFENNDGYSYWSPQLIVQSIKTNVNLQ